MKKIIIPVVLLFAAQGVSALDIADTFTYNTRFWRNNLSVNTRPYYPVNLGAELSLTEHDNFSNHIYAFRLPAALRFENFSFGLRPFYYPDNGNGAEAYGAKFMFNSVLRRDEVEGSDAGVRLSAGLGSQKADIVKNGALPERERFNQAAYEASLAFNYFGKYTFDITGNVYQYLSGISGVESIGGVMDQAELADLGTIDHTLALPDYSLGGKMRWLSDESRSDNFISYRYLELYNDKTAHSLLLSSIINLRGNVFVNFAYNHIFISGAADRDIYAGGILLKF